MSSVANEEEYNVSQEILKEEKLLFEHEIEAISTSLASKLSIAKLNDPIFITKNDSINKRVQQISELLEKKEPILIVCKSNSIPKAISIIEISKQQREDKANLKQLNKLIKQSSLINPNYKYSKQTSKQKNNINEFINGKDLSGHKIYQLPILCTLLIFKDEDSVLEGWSSQHV